MSLQDNLNEIGEDALKVLKFLADKHKVKEGDHLYTIGEIVKWLARKAREVYRTKELKKRMQLQVTTEFKIKVREWPPRETSKIQGQNDQPVPIQQVAPKYSIATIPEEKVDQ